MSFNLTKKAILKKTAQFGGVTLLSRIFGIIREILIARLFGVGAISDAFLASLKLPNFLRRIFAEGSLSAAFVPVFVKKVKDKEFKEANSLMSLTFLFFEGIIFFIVLFVVFFPRLVFYIAAPGFTQEQLNYAIPFLRILFPLIFFFSSSALLAGALNSVNHILIPALGPVVLNIVFILFLLGALFFNFSIQTVCFGVLLGGFLIFLMHLFAYFRYNFTFAYPTKDSYVSLKLVLAKFLPSLFGVSIIEINLFVDTALASFLYAGNLSMLHYAGRFMNIPIGVFAVGFATILLPHFSRYATYAPRRINFQILECAKLITWMVTPAMLFLMFISKEIFTILMFGKVTTVQNALIAKNLLIIYSSGLVFFCLNKVLVNVFYALHDTVSPTIALVFSTILNFVVNIVGMKLFGAYGIAFSTALSGLALTFLFFYYLNKKFKFKFYWANFLNFLVRYIAQLSVFFSFFLSIYFLIFRLLKNSSLYNFFHDGMGFWFIVFSLASFFVLLTYKTRKFFGIKIYFLSK